MMDIGVTHLDESTLFPASSQVAKVLFIAADSCIKNLFIFFAFLANPIYNLSKNLLSGYHKLHNYMILVE